MNTQDSERAVESSLSLEIPAGLLDLIADRVADRLTERMPEGTPEPAPESPSPYLKIEEAAEYLACPVSRIRDLKEQGKLRHYRDGRRLLFRREDLDAALTIREAESR